MNGFEYDSFEKNNNRLSETTKDIKFISIIIKNYEPIRLLPNFGERLRITRHLFFPSTPFAPSSNEK